MYEKSRNPAAINNYLGIILAILALLFLVSLFKNISYPLIWADESMTVMHGERVLKYGYPKVHDGKNVVYDLLHTNPRLGINEKTDAYIGGTNWGHYYVAAIAVKFAEMSNDIYTKTAILRIPFALAGLIGLAILAFLSVQFFESSASKKGFLVTFVSLEIISIPLVLHLREVRYYSLTVFWTALIIFIYTRYRILKKGRYLTYAVVLILSLFFLFVTFSPVYFIFVFSIALFESLAFLKDLFSQHVKKRDQHSPGETTIVNRIIREYLLTILPLLLSLIAVSPLISFFKTFYIAEEMAKFNVYLFDTTRWYMYLGNLFVIWEYFVSFDFIYLAILLKLCLFVFYIMVRSKNISTSDLRRLKFSLFLSISFIVYFFAIARIPNFPYTRYFIPLQPILAVVVIIDALLVYELINLLRPRGLKYYLTIFFIVLSGFFINNIVKNMEHLKGHVYGLSHQYKGPLDYLIPFIKETYSDTEDLVIATNYEETSYMYYLKSRVIIGYVGNNLAEDVLMDPDIVIFRKGWRTLDPEIFADFLNSGDYKRVSLPVVDSNVNNIPELNYKATFVHQFHTLNTGDERKKAVLYYKK